MRRPSPTTAAINSIAQGIAVAARSASELDAAATQDLRSLLSLATSEADRVRKSVRRILRAATSNQTKRPAARGSGKAPAASPAGARKSRKAAVLNGAAH